MCMHLQRNTALSPHWSYDKWTWCSWWEWVIWIISNYRGSRESKEEELRAKENPIKRQLATWGNCNRISPNRRRRVSARLSTACMIQRRLWECNWSWLPVSPIHSCPFYKPSPHLSPLYQRDWLLRKWGFSVTQNHTSLTGGAHAWILSPPFSPRPPGLKEGGWVVGKFGGWADIQNLRDGRFYTRYGNTEHDGHFYYKNILLLAPQPVFVRVRQIYTACCALGDGNWDKMGKIAMLLIQALLFFSQRFKIYVSSHCLPLSLQCGGLAIIICMADINLLYRPCGVPLVTPLQREVNMWDAMDDPLWRSSVWLRNPFSIQRGERSSKRTGTEKRWVEGGGWKESPWKKVK